MKLKKKVVAEGEVMRSNWPSAVVELVLLKGRRWHRNLCLRFKWITLDLNKINIQRANVWTHPMNYAKLTGTVSTSFCAQHVYQEKNILNFFPPLSNCWTKLKLTFLYLKLDNDEFISPAPGIFLTLNITPRSVTKRKCHRIFWLFTIALTFQ